MKKHRVQKTDDLIRLREELGEKVSSIETSDERISSASFTENLRF